MRKLYGVTALAVSLLAVPVIAHAADMRPAPPVAAYMPPPPFSWTGFYVGANVGAGWPQGNVTDSFFGRTYGNSNNNAAFLGGGQIGANYQINRFVIGIEADSDWLANNHNSSTATAVGGTTLQVSSNNRWMTTVAGRVGYAFDRVLVYGKGGGGWVGTNNFTVTNVPTGTSLAFSNGNTNSGWLAGAGVEWAFTNNWTVRAEYDYLGLSNRSYTLPATFPVAALAGDTLTTSNRNVQTFTVGVNYLFNWGSL
jgi:outer membrane immunogenic protein